MQDINIEMTPEVNESDILLSQENTEESIEFVAEGYQPVGVTSVNGKKGKVELKTSDIPNDSDYQSSSQVNTKVVSAINAHDESPSAHPYIRNQVSKKQDTLISGTNIKTVNGQSLLGSGNIDVGDDSTYDASWLFTELTATDQHYTELKEAIENNLIILIHQGNEHYFATGTISDSGDLTVIVFVSSIDTYQSVDYAYLIVAYFTVNGSTKEVELTVGENNGADFAEKLDGKANIYDASWVLTDGTYATNTHYNELKKAIQNRAYIYVIFPDGAVVTVVRSLIQGNNDLFLNGQVSYINIQDGSNYVGITAAEITIESSSKQIRILQDSLSGYNIQQQLNNKADISSVPTKTSDLNNDSGFIDNTVNNLTNYYTKTTNNTFGGMFMPSTEHMTPIKTIEYDTASTTFYKLCSYANNSNSIADIYGEALFRVTVTNEGGTINHKFEIFISMKNAVNTYPYILMRNYPGTTSASTTGVRYIRNLYPRALNNGGNWDMEFQTYNAAARHFKIEVFQADPKFTFYDTLTATTMDSTTQTGGSTQLYTTDGFWELGSNLNMIVSSATSANYISSYLNKFISGTLSSAGQAILAQQMVFLSTDNKFYPSTNTTAPIDPNVGIQLCSNGVNANAAVPASGLRQKYNNATLTNIPHATLTAGDRCFFRCTMDGSGNILSDNYVDTAMSPGYTWYYIGNATSASAINHETTQSMFYTLDANGKLTHINGLPIA